MNKTALKNFATNARNELLKKVEAKAFKIGITEENIKKAQIETSDAIYIDGKQLSITEKKQRDKLIQRIKEIGFKRVMEEVAYTWFNRFIALRFMEVNNYLPTKVRVLSSSNPDNPEPDIIKEALSVDLDIDKDLVYELKVSNKTEELFKYLIIKKCNSLNKYLPFMFETIEDYKEILFPDGLLAKDSFLREMTDVSIIPESDWEQVEIIGWLYQYYISEKKDQVFADLKKNIKISKENIPSATQLFTPHWIVRYMVENSLGRIWLSSYPESALKSEWKYYLEEAEQEEEVRKKLDEIRYSNLNPEDITFLDPCCGSGHILVYAFDVFYEMYLEKGYINHEIPKLIMEKNLFGLDIDDRAAQLASFAVMMKAREKSRRVFGQDIKLNICAIQESNWITDDMINIIVGGLTTKEEQNTQIKILEYLRDTYWDAKDYGSIINVESLDLNTIEKRMNNLEQESYDLIKMIVREELMDRMPSILQQSRIMGRKFDVVCTNPPYMGNNGMTPKLATYLKQTYPNTKSDLSTVFMEKAMLLCKPTGLISMINIPVWMFLSSYEGLREYIIENKTFVNMLHLGRGVFGSDFGTTAFVIFNENIAKYRATYGRLFRDKGDVDNLEEKEQWFFERNGFYHVDKEGFKSIPSSPIAYWANKKIIQSFVEDEKLSDIGEAKSGLQTGNNDLFLKQWYEVAIENIAFNMNSREQFNSTQKKWIPQIKGGAYRRWYGNFDYVVNWENDGYEIKQCKGCRLNAMANDRFFFKEGVTWSHSTAGGFGARYLPTGLLFNVEAPTFFANQLRNINYILAYLNSKVAAEILKLLNSTLHYLVGDILRLPIKLDIDAETYQKIDKLVSENIYISKTEWDCFELSWDFKRHPFLLYKCRTIKDSYENWDNFSKNQHARLKTNEEELNLFFIEDYGLQEELSPEVEDKDITIRLADRIRDIKSFVSYSVGCIFGRYSLDKEGIIFAGGKFDPINYQKFIPDNDNILPILSGAYFEDDIVSRFIEFVKVTFGEETLEENLEYIANYLGKKDGETAKEAIRRYFLNDFFKDHVQTYKKRPIYWLFTSGKQKAFNCLIYMHRYDKSTLSRIRTDYLHELQNRLDAERKSLLSIIEGDGTAKEISNTKKELKALDLKVEELKAYDELLHHMADMQIEIDLDEGVAVNYAKFEGLVAKI
ncbi:BREX-1 system adenine-specific DNA-methyltransferase PglX [Brevibacillus agri]|uniref:BREX-1 system adenine-specific DNA-methyltransferase PglX n=1 Tax=Brevibacillus agri TaxID=51101 RepID=UPI003D7256AD